MVFCARDKILFVFMSKNYLLIKRNTEITFARTLFAEYVRVIPYSSFSYRRNLEVLYTGHNEI